MACDSESILLYKFIGPHWGLQNLRDRLLKVGRIKEFNDPFEWRMGISGIASEEEDAAKVNLDSLVEGYNELFGVLCFSSTIEEPVLWAHYAENHSGIALEVNYPVEPHRLFKIEYSTERPTYDAAKRHDRVSYEQYLTEILKKIMSRKSFGWQYEKEYRAFVDPKDCIYDNGMAFKRIPDDFLTRVVLGIRCTLTEAQVRSALAEGGFDSSVEVVRAKLCPRQYRILA